MPKPPIRNVLFPADQIRRRVESLAEEIAADSPAGDLIGIAVLDGSFVFLADLARELTGRGIHLVIDFLALSSYGAGTTSTGRVTLRRDIALPVAGRRVLLIDDILDTGGTLRAARELLLARGAVDVRACVLLDKPSPRRLHSVKAEYVGFVVEDIFVVGYGLDYDHHYRQLPYLAALTV